MTRGKMTPQERGRIGGERTRDKVAGTDYYNRLGLAGGTALREKLGIEHYVEMGKRSAEVRRKKREAARLQAARELVAAADKTDG